MCVVSTKCRQKNKNKKVNGYFDKLTHFRGMPLGG